ncbi:hypothetical protein GCM10007103_11340 [Salinimicrobium marinum]|uniref:Uncharacterized protein n=1 Tax=Salinimicrobium marinum TaxID=680283 RepID=A0A918SAQ9_9FLAO|nr:hypothetical protein [Salinimicrobium marinum]GHA31434.1 hypothetical protein GCM10007103_11340 [Salinimicrobium marinum]
MDFLDTTTLLQEKNTLPVKYVQNQKFILDLKGLLVCDIRWSRMQFMDKGQDVLGEMVAKLLNQSGADHNEKTLQKIRRSSEG